jgi:hypothetical protein
MATRRPRRQGAVSGPVCQRPRGERSKRCEDTRRRRIPAGLDRTHHSRAHLGRHLGLLQGDEERRGEPLQLGGIAERGFVVEHLQRLRNDPPLQKLGLGFGDVGWHRASVGAVSARTRARPTLTCAKCRRAWNATNRQHACWVRPAGFLSRATVPPRALDTPRATSANAGPQAKHPSIVGTGSRCEPSTNSQDAQDRSTGEVSRSRGPTSSRETAAFSQAEA